MSALTQMLDDLDAKAAKATPGKWTAETWVEQDGDGWVARGPLRRDTDDDDREPDGPSHILAQKDAELMAAAVNAAPLLSRIVRAAVEYRAAVDERSKADNAATRLMLFNVVMKAESNLFSALDAAEAEVKS